MKKLAKGGKEQGRETACEEEARTRACDARPAPRMMISSSGIEFCLVAIHESALLKRHQSHLHPELLRHEERKRDGRLSPKWTSV